MNSLGTRLSLALIVLCGLLGFTCLCDAQFGDLGSATGATLDANFNLTNDASALSTTLIVPSVFEKLPARLAETFKAVDGGLGVYYGRTRTEGGVPIYGFKSRLEFGGQYAVREASHTLGLIGFVEAAETDPNTWQKGAFFRYQGGIGNFAMSAGAGGFFQDGEVPSKPDLVLSDFNYLSFVAVSANNPIHLPKLGDWDTSALFWYTVSSDGAATVARFEPRIARKLDVHLALTFQGLVAVRSAEAQDRDGFGDDPQYQLLTTLSYALD